MFEIKAMFRLVLLGFSFLFSSLVYGETLKKGSVVCWGEATLKAYIKADLKTKKHMEEHECGILTENTKAKILKTKMITVNNMNYSITNIIFEYQDHGEIIDNVWVFTNRIIDSKT